MDRLDYIARQQGRLTVSGAPQGYDAQGLAGRLALAEQRERDRVAGPLLGQRVGEPCAGRQRGAVHLEQHVALSNQLFLLPHRRAGRFDERNLHLFEQFFALTD